MSSKKTHTISLIIAFLFMFALTFSFPYISDDLHFKFVFYGFNPDGRDKRIESLADVIVSLKNYYKMSGGRILAHTVLYTVNCFAKPVFDLLNAAAFSIFGLLIYKLAGQTSAAQFRSVSRFILPIIYLLSFVFLPSFGDTVIWMSGSINYLWMSLVPLTLLSLLFADEGAAPKNKYASAAYILICILSLLSGLTNEVTGGMLIVFAAVFLIQKRSGFPIKLLLPALLILLGTGIVVLAPGNAARAAAVDKTEIFSLIRALKVLPDIISYYCENYAASTAVILLANIVFYDKRPGTAYSISFFLSGIAGFTALSLSGTFIKRSSFTPSVFIFVSFILSLIKLYDLYKNGFPRISRPILRLSAVAAAFAAMTALSSTPSISSLLTAVILSVAYILALCAKTDPKRTLAIKAMLEKIKKRGKVVFCTILTLLCLYIAKNTVIYFRTTAALNNYENKFKLAADSGNSITITRPEIEPCIFIPDESRNYGVWWHSIYYGINITFE